MRKAEVRNWGRNVVHQKAFVKNQVGERIERERERER